MIIESSFTCFNDLINLAVVVIIEGYSATITGQRYYFLGEMRGKKRSTNYLQDAAGRCSHSEDTPFAP